MLANKLLEIYDRSGSIGLVPLEVLRRILVHVRDSGKWIIDIAQLEVLFPESDIEEVLEWYPQPDRTMQEEALRYLVHYSGLCSYYPKRGLLVVEGLRVAHCLNDFHGLKSAVEAFIDGSMIMVDNSCRVRTLTTMPYNRHTVA